MEVMEAVRVALDWNANTNHAGMFVAMEKGLYAKEGVRVDLICAEDVYAEKKTDEISSGSGPTEEENVCVPRTPAGLVLAGRADLAVCPSETVISSFVKSDAGDGDDSSHVYLVAVAALLNRDASAIVSLAGGNDNGIIARPKDLDGKKYGSYAARYEGRIVQEMIRADGGAGTYDEICPAKLGIWETLIGKKLDATWVFMNWEGVAAARQLGAGSLNAFTLEEYGIPYGYTPLLVASSTALEDARTCDTIARFLKATSEGYAMCVREPQAAARLFIDRVKADARVLEFDEDTVIESFVYTAPYFTDTNRPWGEMELARWDAFLDWLAEKGLLTDLKQSRQPDAAKKTTTLDALRAGRGGKAIDRRLYIASKMFTNALLPSAR